MPDAQVLYAESASDVTASTTSWVDVCSIADTSFTAGKKYLILAIAYLRCGSATNDARIRLVHGTTPTAFTDASGSYELTANTQRTCVGFMCTFTQPGTAELVKLQISNASTSTTTCDMGQIIVIKLDDDFTENTDYYFNEVTADYTTTTSFAAQAAVTFTPNGTDDWLIIAQAAITPGSVTDPYRMSLHDSVEGLDEPSLELEGEDTTNEIREHLIMRVHTPSNASHTFSARFNHTTVASTVLSSRIFAINLSKFSQHVFAYTAAEDAPSASPTWETEQTVSITPSATGDFVILGYYTNDIGNSGDNLGSRLQVNNGGGLASDPNYGDDAPTTDGWDSADQTPFEIGKVRSLSTGGSRTINLDVRTVTGTTVRVQERTLVVFSVALSSSTQTITASAIASAEAFGTDRFDFTLLPSALASAEAFGTARLDLTLLMSAIASAEAFGTAQINLELLMAAIASAEAFGTTVLTPGEVSVAPSAISSLEAFGAPTITIYITPSGVASAEAFGTAQLDLALLLTGVASAEAFGTARLDLALLLSGLASAEAFGDSIVSGDGGQFVTPSGVASAEAFGTDQIDFTLLPSALASAEAFGDSALSLYLLPSGVASAEAFGSPRLDFILLPSGLTSAEAFGDAVVNVSGSLSITAVAIASAEVFGTTIVLWFATPADRVIVVPIDDRLIEVERESRVLAMAADDRTHEVN